MRNYKELLKAGNAAQLEKLKENKHKDGFDNIDIYYAYKRLIEEKIELGDELYQPLGRKDFLDYQKIKNEAADVANFAHMIILKCKKELSK